MKPLKQKALSFALQFVPLFIVGVLAYAFVQPTYQRLVLGASNGFTERMSPRMRLDTNQEGGWQLSVRSARGRPMPVMNWDPFVAHLVLLGLAILPALLLATPAPYLERLRLLAFGLGLLFCVQVLAVVLLAWASQCLREAPGTFHCLWILRLVYTSGQISAAVVWALLTWRLWLPRSPVARSPST